MRLEIFPANIRLEDILKSPFIFVFKRLLQNVFKTFWSRRIYSLYPYVFRRCLQDNFKMSWSRPINWSWLYVLNSLRDVLKMLKNAEKCLKTSCKNDFKTSWRRLQDVFKTSSRHFHDVLLKLLEEIFKISWRRLAKTFSRHLQDIFRRFEYIFSYKTSSVYLQE